MFCPRCSTENKPEQHYCRHCGLPLPAVRLALEGQIDEAIKKYKKSENAFDWSFVVLLIAGLNAAINTFFSAWPIAIASVALGFVLGIILILVGMSRMGQGNKILNPPEKKDEPGNLLLNQSERAEGSTLPPAPITEELKRTPAPRPQSIVENTTLELKRPE